MSLLAWIILGLIAGTLGTKLAGGEGGGCLKNMVLGVVGALVGGFSFRAIGGAGVTGFNLWSIFVATIGACIVIAIASAFSAPPPAKSD